MCFANIGCVVLKKDSFAYSVCFANVGCVVLKNSFAYRVHFADTGCVLRKDSFTYSMCLANIGCIVLRKDCLTCSMCFANIGCVVCAGVSTGRNAHCAMWSGSHHCSLQVLHLTHLSLNFRLHSWGLLLMIITVISLVPRLSDTSFLLCHVSVTRHFSCATSR